MYVVRDQHAAGSHKQDIDWPQPIAQLCHLNLPCKCCTIPTFQHTSEACHKIGVRFCDGPNITFKSHMGTSQRLEGVAPEISELSGIGDPCWAAL